MSVHVLVDHRVILSYKRLSYTPWHALAEFIDNSTQAYRNNKVALDALYEGQDQLTVDITYVRGENKFVISDNSIGMSEQELDRALDIGVAPEKTDGRSEFGMGLKTAACWFGNYWTVSTKREGAPQGLEVMFDVPEVAKGGENADLDSIPFIRPQHWHGTIITISELHRTFYGREINTIKQFLSGMYRDDIETGELTLTWGGVPLVWNPEYEFHQTAPNAHTDAEGYWKKPFEFSVNEKPVRGWVAVLESGGRGKAGLAMKRRGRVLKGWPDPWRPSSIFGQFQGSNNLVNQRIVGEVELDRFSASHTKDDIEWDADEQEDVEKHLQEIFWPYLEEAARFRRRTKVERPPNDREIQSAFDLLREEIDTAVVIEALRSSFSGSHTAAILYAQMRKAFDANTLTRFDVQLNGTSVAALASNELSDRNPYVGITNGGDHVVEILVNLSHPAFLQTRGTSGALNYFRSAVFDALAAWKTESTLDQQDTGSLLFKDALLRLSATGLEAAE